MGIERPTGPYSTEMTAGAAWPNVDEDAYRRRAEELRRTRTQLTAVREQWERQRTALFDSGRVWSGNAAIAADAEVDSRIRAMRALEGKLRSGCTQAETSATVITDVKTQVSDNVKIAQRIIAQISSMLPGGGAGIQQDVVLATYATNVAEVARGAALLDQGQKGCDADPPGEQNHIQPVDDKKVIPALSDARRRAIGYADVFAGSYNPDYKNFEDGRGDCTNFLSQVLRAGGFGDVGNSWDDWHRGDPDDWYYNNQPHIFGNQFSNTWAVAKANHDFMISSGRGQVVGTATMPDRKSLDPLAPSKAGLLPGDLIYYRNKNGSIEHTAVYVGQKDINGVLTDVVDQHGDPDISRNFRNDWMPENPDYIGGSAAVEFVHVAYPGER